MVCGASFLEQCDPRAKLVALFLVMPLLLSQPLFSWQWGGAAGLSLLAVLAGLTPVLAALSKLLWKLRWFFLTLMVLHLLLTPGRPLVAGWIWITWEGLREGGHQIVRLVFLVSLSWILVRTTTAMQWLFALFYLFGFLEGVGVPVKQGVTIMAFALGRIPVLVREAYRVRDELSLRCFCPSHTDWRRRLQRTVWGGEALLYRALMMACCQEEALHVRGFETGLPFMMWQKKPFGWRDWMLLGWPTVLLCVTLWQFGVRVVAE